MSPGDFPPGLIGVPCVHWMWTRSAMGLMRLQQSAPEGTELTFKPAASTIATKRNAVIEQALEEPRFRWVLMADSDMDFPAGAVQRLLRTARETEADLVSALTVMRTPPHDVCAGFVVEEGAPPEDPRRAAEAEGLETGFLNPEVVARKRPEPAAVHFAGAAALLIRRHVLEDLDEPWFVADEGGVSEDTNFTIRCTLGEGHRLVVDTGLEVGHVSSHPFGLEDAVREHRREDRERRRAAEAEARRRAAIERTAARMRAGR